MKCFVIMPFSDSFNEYYTKVLKPAIQECNLTVIRADEIYGLRAIIEDIAEGITNADIIVADVTGKNPNVNYELGMAHALEKKVILISQEKKDIPFDYRHIRYIIYDPQEKNWEIDLRSKLINTIHFALSDSFKPYKIESLTQYHQKIAINEIGGIKAVFETRQEANMQINKAWNDLKNELDIIGFGFKSFRDSQTQSMIEKVRKGLKLRILTINPMSSFVKKREKDEHQLEGSISKTILDLKEWVEHLKEVSKNPNNVQIKFYNSLPLDFYWRQEDDLYVGPYLYGKGSQQTITFEVQKDSKGYKIYRGYFESLWTDRAFCKSDYRLFD